jgi:transposase
MDKLSPVARKNLENAPGAVSPSGKVAFRVRSFTGNGFYRVSLELGVWKCECGAWENGNGKACKHIRRLIEAIDPFRPPVTDVDLLPYAPRSYGQDWPAYDTAQQSEHKLFDPLLWDLLESVPETLKPVGKGGRPGTPLRVQLLIAIKKVHLQQSSRRARGLMDTQYATGKGLLAYTPNYTTSSRLFNRPETTGLLLDLIRQSALPLRDIEDGGAVAIDSTGFCTSCRGAWCSEAHDLDRRHIWVKAHLAVGTKTHIVLGVKITDEYGADYPQFAPLLRGVAEAGFTPAKVVADKSYLGRDNLGLASALGIDPLIPFKSNSTGKTKGSRMWQRKYYEFTAKREEFDAKYHARSNVESAISAIKRKLGEPLLSKNSLGRFNELLSKILSYNLGVIVHEIFEHGIDPGVSGVPALPKPKPPEPPSSSVQPPCESIPAGVAKPTICSPG